MNQKTALSWCHTSPRVFESRYNFAAKLKGMTPEELKEKVENTSGIVLYFKNDRCAPCMALRPKVEELVAAQFPEMEFLILDTVEQPTLSSAYNVFANPTILVFFEGKEYVRKSKYIGTSELGQEIDRFYQMVF